ncbi:MAG: cysteate synthase [Candidatus Thermoplasmatota archaeon]|nr:cysteate synthase [Candidatus Thermoplasmatota archaeon]
MKYQLKCLKTGDIIDDQYTLHYTDNALLRAIYHHPFELNDGQGVWKYLSWLPTQEVNDYAAGTVTYKAEALGHRLGLSNLWITFHGYWPEKGGLCPTGSFKDMEAVPTIQRLKEHGKKGIICASAGNTARAFTHFCGLSDTPLIVVVGKDHGHRVWVRPENPATSVRLIVVEDGDYYDAKTVAKGIAPLLEGWQMEGSVHNVARRDGIGSLMLDAAFTIGHLPDHYFQGIGGGPGPIGIHEMAQRLVDEGLFEGPVPRQHVSQNIEHCPIHNAWQDGRDHLVEDDFPPHDVEVYSDYLMNKGPAYGQVGGVHDILKASKGQTYVVSRDDAIAAKQLVESIEDIDIMTPGAVATASLMQALEKGEVLPDDCIVLNISGGGIKRLKDEQDIDVLEPWLRVKKSNAVDAILEKLSNG